MRASRVLLLVALLVIVSLVSWFAFSTRHSSVGNQLTMYYTKIDGKSEIPWTVSMRPLQPGEGAAEHLHNAVLYAATQAVAGPASTIDAVRFPPGTQVLSVDVTGSTATVNLSKAVAAQPSTFGEEGEFKSLVWTLTALPAINAVAIRVEGQKLLTLPGGHLELDQPLRRSDF
ncbi:MAG: GerMN domain-containing protein [Candidatus Eremiobacteraeota bacterium]|nr:GerMN domain-containing protein [Candidatus Eremiobacteraeota bacterium]